jgi:hypothetical protein
MFGALLVLDAFAAHGPLSVLQSASAWVEAPALVPSAACATLAPTLTRA